MTCRNSRGSYKSVESVDSIGKSVITDNHKNAAIRKNFTSIIDLFLE